MLTYSSKEAFRLNQVNTVIIDVLNDIVANILDEAGLAPIVRFEDVTTAERTSFIWNDELDSYECLTY